MEVIDINAGFFRDWLCMVDEANSTSAECIRKVPQRIEQESTVSEDNSLANATEHRYTEAARLMTGTL